MKQTANYNSIYLTFMLGKHYVSSGNYTKTK